MYVKQSSGASPSSTSLPSSSVRARAPKGGLRVGPSSEPSITQNGNVQEFAQRKMLLSRKSPANRVAESIQRINTARKARPLKLPGLVEG